MRDSWTCRGHSIRWISSRHPAARGVFLEKRDSRSQVNFYDNEFQRVSGSHSKASQMIDAFYLKMVCTSQRHTRRTIIDIILLRAKLCLVF